MALILYLAECPCWRKSLPRRGMSMNLLKDESCLRRKNTHYAGVALHVSAIRRMERCGDFLNTLKTRNMKNRVAAVCVSEAEFQLNLLTDTSTRSGTD